MIFKKRKFTKQKIIFLAFLILLLFIWLNQSLNVTTLIVNPSNRKTTTTDLNRSLTIPIYDAYISADYKICSGLGNQLFRFAIYYGIGREINRSPFFHANKKCQIEAMIEIKEIFPNFYKHVKLLNATPNESEYVDIVTDCCNYERISNASKKYLIFKQNLPQFFTFFQKYNYDVRYFLEFDKSLMENVSNLAKEIFGEDKSHKFCVHIRRGDFMNPSYKYQESRSNFIVPAANYIHSYLLNKGYSNISLVLMGQDDEFKHSLKINFTLFKAIYFPTLPSRSHDLAFGAIHCDTFLISASISTFAWWTAYLMPKNKIVFYNGKLLKHGNYEKENYDKIFPPSWIKLDL